MIVVFVPNGFDADAMYERYYPLASLLLPRFLVIIIFKPDSATWAVAVKNEPP